MTSPPRGVYPWGAYVITSGDAVAVAREACRGGARIIQYRDKTSSRRRALDEARQIRGLTREASALLVVNDQLDLALLSEADGVHLGQDDFPVAEARRLAGRRLIVGVSTHSVSQARAAEADGADYVGVGPVFGTPTKPSYQAIGLEQARAMIAAVSIPCVLIGGLDLDNLPEIVAAGAKNAAMVRALARDTRHTLQRANSILLG